MVILCWRNLLQRTARGNMLSALPMRMKMIDQMMSAISTLSGKLKSARPR